MKKIDLQTPLDILTAEYREWWKQQGFKGEPVSADEAMELDLTSEQRARLIHFIQRWENWDRIQAVGWNTGALYSDRGQRIAAAYIEHNADERVVVFVDVDRYIDGEIPVARQPRDAKALKEIVTMMYNQGCYGYTYEPIVGQLQLWAREHL